MTASLTCRSAGLSHVGLVRSHNEDAWLARSDLGLWAVADGMGGHVRGDLASAMIVEALGRLAPPPDAPSHLRAVEEALRSVHVALHRLPVAAGEICGSTVVALLAFGRHHAVVWCGDSRAYRLRKHRLERLTQDHSPVEEMVRRGLLTAEAARIHPFRNRITHAVGSDNAEQLHLERQQGELLPNDLFLLCSDGLTGELDDATIARLLLAGPTPEAGAEALVEAALAAGGSDNITAVLVAVRESKPDPDLTWPDGRPPPWSRKTQGGSEGPSA